jgi:cytochrome c-type biogenesis protein
MSIDLSWPQLGLSLAAGSLTTLSPCVLPLLPLVVGGATQRNRLAPVAMGLGMATAFALIGLVVGTLGPLIGLDADHVRVAGAVLLILLALVFWIPAWSERFAQWAMPLATSAQNASAGLDAGSLKGAFLLGGVLGLVWSPCSGPLLASALTLVVSEGGALPGALILGVFGVGAAVPLVAVAYASRAGFARWRDRALHSANGIKKGFGLLLGLAGVAILMGWDKQLEAWVVDVLPDAWLRLTTAI